MGRVGGREQERAKRVAALTICAGDSSTRDAWSAGSPLEAAKGVRKNGAGQNAGGCAVGLSVICVLTAVLELMEQLMITGLPPAM